MKLLKTLLPALAVLLVAVIALVPTLLSNRQLRKALDAKSAAPGTTAVPAEKTLEEGVVPAETTTRAAREKLIGLGAENLHVWADADGRAYLSINVDPDSMDASTWGVNGLKKLYASFTDCSPRGYQDYLGGTTLRGVDLGLENVEAVYSYNLGNGREHPFFFVDRDGNLYMLSTLQIFSSGEIDLRRLDVENVATVMPGDMDGGGSPFAVLRDGTEIWIYDLMH